MPFIDMKTSKQQWLFSIEGSVYDVIRKKYAVKKKSELIVS